MTHTVAEHEFRNWSAWCNQGPYPGPDAPGSFLDGVCVPNPLTSEEADARPIIHEDSAKRVQAIFEAAVKVEKRVLQAEYLSPWRYDRFRAGISAAVQKIKAMDPDLSLSAATYEIILANLHRRVERAFT